MMPLERPLLLEALSLAERHIRQGGAMIELQRSIIETLKQRGQDASLARRLLNTFEETQSLWLARRDALWRELSQNR